MFHIHKRQVKGGHKISLDLATKLLDDGYECLPGWQLCRACYDNAQKNEIIENSQSENESQMNKLDSTVTNFSTSDITSDEEARVISRDSVNISLESIGGSPIKTHSMPKHRKLSYINEKLDKTMGCLKRSFAAAVGVDESSLTAANERCSEESAYEVKIKADDLDRLTEQMREKLTTGTTTYAEKVQILTLTPDSWTIKKAASYFGVSEYQVRQARDLKKSRGILSKPDNNRGKPLSESTERKSNYSLKMMHTHV